MRTVIFVGLLYIGDAIGTPQYGDAAIMWLFLIVLLAAATMDVTDFVRAAK